MILLVAVVGLVLFTMSRGRRPSSAGPVAPTPTGGSVARRGRSELPADTPQRMESFGRFSIEPTDSPVDVGDWETFYRPYQPTFQSDPERFVHLLADTVEPVGGWAVFGAQRYVLDVVPDQIEHPRNLAMMDVGVRYVLTEGGYTRQHLNRYELQRLMDTDS